MSGPADLFDLGGKAAIVTGASSGIGRATAEHFQQQGWNVVATMRDPKKAGDLAEHENVLVTRLDVLDRDSIVAARDAALGRFGQVDVLLNNAGYGAYGPLEAFSMEGVERQFDTNVIGLLAVTKAFLPHMRERASGTIINVSSIGGQMTFPLGALYHGSKFAVEGLSEALHYELGAFGVQVKIVQPGMIQTDFGGRSFDFQNDESLAEYQGTVKKLFGYWRASPTPPSPPSTVAEVVFAAATDGTPTLRYRAGADAEALLDARKAQDDATFLAAMKTQIGV